MRAESDLIRHKVALYDLALTSQTLEAALHRAAADWERDLRPLLPHFVPWPDLAPFLEALRELLAIG